MRVENQRPDTTRRAVLTLGGLALLSACDVAGTPQDARPVAHSSSPPPLPSPSPSASAAPVRVEKRPQYALEASSAGKKTVALTFDDGPHPTFTPQVLSILRKRDVTATFFVLGCYAAAHPDLLRSIVDAGHTIGTHSWSHANLPSLTPTKVRTEIERPVEKVSTATGVRPTLFRAPYGSWSPGVFRQCAELGQRSIAWNVDPHDWDNPGAGHIGSRVLDQVGHRSIILNHDGGGDRSQTVAALRDYLPRLLDAGYRFVGV